MSTTITLTSNTLHALTAYNAATSAYEAALLADTLAPSRMTAHAVEVTAKRARDMAMRLASQVSSDERSHQLECAKAL